MIGNRFDRLDAIVHEEHLTTAIEFARDRFFDQRVIERLHEREHRRPIARRRLHEREIAQPRQALVQRTRNRRGREREHIGLQLELLEPFLVLHTEAMLFIDHDEPEIRKLDVGAEQAVRPDHDVDLLLLELLDDHGLFLGRLEAAHDFHRDREVGQSIAEASCVLLRQNSGGDEHRHLPPPLHRFKGRANGDLGFAVAHVAHEQAVHRTVALEIALHVFGRFTLVGRIFEQERALELPLPRRVHPMRGTGRHFATRIEIQQFLRHLENGHARFFALLLPAIATQLVQPRGGRVFRHIAGAAVSLNLIDAIQRHIQTIAALVLDDRGLDRAFAHEDLFNAAIDADAVLEVHDVVTRLERPDGIERCPGGVLARAAQPAITTKNLVIREHAHDVRNNESAAQHADRERRRQRAIFAEQFIETLHLAGVVAQDDRGQSVALQLAQHAQVARDGFRRTGGERHIGLGALRLKVGRRGTDRALWRRRNTDGAETRQRTRHLGRRHEQALATHPLFAATTREFEMVRGLIPRAHQLRQHRCARRHDDHRIGWPQRGQRHPFGIAIIVAHPPIDRQDQRELGITRAALRIEIEVAQLDDVVTPELEAHRLGHAERVDVDDATAHGELRYVFDHRYAFEADRLQMGREIFQAAHIALAQLEPRPGQSARQGSLLEYRTGGGEQETHPAAPQFLERFHPFASHFGMRLDLAEAFTRRIERHGDVVDQRLEVGQPAFGVTDLIGDDHHQTLRQRAGEGGHEHRVGRPGESTNAETLTGTGNGLVDSCERGQRLDRIEQSGEAHQCLANQASARSAASANATSGNNNPCPAARSNTSVRHALTLVAGVTSRPAMWVRITATALSAAPCPIPTTSDSSGSGFTTNAPMRVA